MMTRALLVLLLCSLLAGAGNAEPSPDPTNKDCHRGDKAALLAVKAALGDPYLLSYWTPDSLCCDWNGVTCDHLTGRVVGLPVFQDANITGTIPSALPGLPHLENLFLHHLPGLSGHIPPAIGKLSNLSSLRMSFNSLSGAMPSFVGALKKLTLLDLSFNSLSGAIPASLGTIPNLSGINLICNRLTGAIPMFLSKSMDQVYLWLSHNNLRGPISEEFAAVNFTHLDLSRNTLTGDASGLFGSGKKVRYIDMSRNAFDFDLSGVVLPEQIYTVD